MGKVWGSLREREVIITKGSQSIITMLENQEKAVQVYY